MSTRKARLIKPTNFNINSYYNTYNNKQAILNNKISRKYTICVKRSNYSVTNNKSLQYSSIYKNVQVLLETNPWLEYNISVT